MKKQILLFTVLLFSTFFYAQNTKISIGPKTFQKEIACKISLLQSTDVVVRVFDVKTEVKQFKFEQVKATALKMNLEELKAGKTYTISVYNAKEELLYTREITKSKK